MEEEGEGQKGEEREGPRGWCGRLAGKGRLSPVPGHAVHSPHGPHWPLMTLSRLIWRQEGGAAAGSSPLPALMETWWVCTSELFWQWEIGIKAVGVL